MSLHRAQRGVDHATGLETLGSELMLPPWPKLRARCLGLAKPFKAMAHQLLHGWASVEGSVDIGGDTWIGESQGLQEVRQ